MSKPMQQREELTSSARLRSRASGWMAGRSGEQEARSSLDGLWLVLVEGQEDQKLGPTFEGRVPMLARAGDDQTYLLGFRNMPSARRFLARSPVAGVLVDYDPDTRGYSSAAALF